MAHSATANILHGYPRLNNCLTNLLIALVHTHYSGTDEISEIPRRKFQRIGEGGDAGRRDKRRHLLSANAKTAAAAAAAAAGARNMAAATRHIDKC